MTQRRVENTRVHFWTLSPVSVITKGYEDFALNSRTSKFKKISTYRETAILTASKWLTKMCENHNMFCYMTNNFNNLRSAPRKNVFLANHISNREGFLKCFSTRGSEKYVDFSTRYLSASQFTYTFEVRWFVEKNRF